MSWTDRESDFEQGTDEWLKDRMGKLTGSIVGEIMPGARGGKPVSRKKLLYKKAIEYMAGVDESKPIPKLYADWGHEYEAEACQAIQDELNGSMVEDLEFQEVNLITSEFSPLVASSLDRFDINGKYAVEVKCPFYMSSHIKHMKENPVINCRSDAKNYYWQVRHHMLCTGAEWCIWGSYHPHFEPKKLHIEIIKRDEDEMELLKTECLSFVDDMRSLCKDIMK